MRNRTKCPKCKTEFDIRMNSLSDIIDEIKIAINTPPEEIMDRLESHLEYLKKNYGTCNN